MPVDLAALARNVEPERTVLLFGSGSSMPSGAPSVKQIQNHFEKTFGVPASDYTLAEQAALIESQIPDRADLIRQLQSQFRSLEPTGGLRNLPLYSWKSIFTTNYDELIEEAYKRRRQPLTAYTSNFDFKVPDNPTAIKLFKLHGTIQKDVSFGDNSRIILTQSDYDKTEDYREHLYDRLKSDLAGARLIIIGHSLTDRDISAVVDRALSLRTKSGSSSIIDLLLYLPDPGRARLFENRGMEVCFGGLDDFFAALVNTIRADPPPSTSSDPLDAVPALRPATIDVNHSMNTRPPDVSAMYNGWAVTYADIKAGFTFQRNTASAVERQLKAEDKRIAIILGASGVGKTSACRQAMVALSACGLVWEHKLEQILMPDKWREIARLLRRTGSIGTLMIDEAHGELPQINQLVEFLEQDNITSLRLILISTHHQWHFRIKVPALNKQAVIYTMSKVEGNEIDRLIALIEGNLQIRALATSNFLGFNLAERRRRLAQRCSADMFVCLKNIFELETAG